MHVVMLSDLETQGGAAIGASRLAEGLIKAGARVTRLVGYPDGQTHPWTTQLLGGLLRRRFVWKLMQGISKRLSLQLAMLTQEVWVKWLLHRILRRLNPDVIIVHNLHLAGWWPDLISACAHHAPAIWALHDMWSFTGRCAYSYDCRKFISGCDASCPTPDEYPALAPKLISGAWELRRHLLAEHLDLVAVCPSYWLAKEALTGLWKGHRVEVIPYGLALETYRPIDRNLARAALGIDTVGPVLLVSAQSMQERRKGMSILVEALRRVSHRPLTLITMGRGSLPINSEDIYLHSLGYIDHERTKVLVYNAADVLVHPAPVDNLPFVVLEAIACGTPVIGFPIGGLLDLARPGQTGWLADAVTPEALAATIDIAIRDLHVGTDLRSFCLAIAQSEYSSELQTRRYLELMRSLGVSGSAD